MNDKYMQSTVLFVDADENILTALRRGLFDVDYHCVFAQSGHEALALLEIEEVAVIVSDMRMPDMDGLHLLRLVKEKFPRVVRIVLSGYTQLQQILATINTAGVFKFITKPWMMDEELKVVIEEALDYYLLIEHKEALETALRKQNASYQNILKKHETLLDTATRQTALIGIIASDALAFLEERSHKAPILPAELAALGSILRRFAANVVTDPVNRTGADVTLLVRNALSHHPRLTGIDAVPYQEVHPIRLNVGILESMSALLPEILIAPDTTCRVRMALRTEEVDSLGMLAVSLLFLRSDSLVENPQALPPERMAEIPSEKATEKPQDSHPDKTPEMLPDALPGVSETRTPAAILAITNRVLDLIMGTMQGHFQSRDTSVGVLCRFLLPLRQDNEGGAEHVPH